MSLRVCLVSPFAWSQPHDVNEHVAGVAAGLRRLGHHVTVLAPSSRTADLLAGRRALLDGADAEVIALGPALPVSRRSRVGVPVGVRANLSLALAVGRYDVVHGFEPGLPSLSYLALRDAQALAVATFLSPERLGYPPGRSQRERLLGRVDALVATSEETAEAAATRFPGEYTVVSPGVDLDLFRPGEKRRLAVLEWRPTERPLARAVIRALREVPDWELILLRTKPAAPRGRSARRPRVDPLRPPHAHELVARLPRRGRRAPRARGARGAGRDRRHRPQRPRRRARGPRARARPRPRRRPGRGGQDRRPGRGDRPLPLRGDPARPLLRRHDRRHPLPGRPRLPPPPVRPAPRDPRRADPAPAPRRHRRLRGLQRPAPLRCL